MAIRLERSGDLIFIRGAHEEPPKPKRAIKRLRRLGLLVALIALVMGLLFAGPHMLGWPVVSHTFKAFVTAIW